MFESYLKPPISFPTLTGSIVIFNSQYAGLPLASCNIALTATQSGSGTPSPDNVRTINGYSAINIGNISDNTNISYFQGLLNGTYGFVDLGTLNWNYRNDGTTYAPYFWCYTNISPFPSDIKYIGEFSSTAYNIICAKYKTTSRNTTNFIDKTIVADGGAYNVTQIQIKDLAYNDAATFKTAMSGVYLIYELATPTTPSFTSAEFEALCESFGMNGQSFTIQIGSTVYGGEYDARTGVLTVTHGYLDLGTLTWGYSGSVFYSSVISTLNSPTNNIICSSYETVPYNIPSANMPDKSIKCYGGIEDKIIYIKDFDYTDPAVFKTNMSGVQLVYELATPTTIQLPPCPIDTFEGVNNIWADTGDTTLQYIKFG